MTENLSVHQLIDPNQLAVAASMDVERLRAEMPGPVGSVVIAAEIGQSDAPQHAEADEHQVNPEITASEPGLAVEQIATLKHYLVEAADKNSARKHLALALTRMNESSKQVGDDSGLGEIAVCAVALGSLSHDPDALHQAAPALIKRMTDNGLQKEHASTMLEIQKVYTAKPGATDIGLTLVSGLKYLDRRKQLYGDDITQGRIAFLSSGLAASQDANLRKFILRQLRP